VRRERLYTYVQFWVCVRVGGWRGVFVCVAWGVAEAARAMQCTEEQLLAPDGASTPRRIVRIAELSRTQDIRLLSKRLPLRRAPCPC
jgi:hypothetical protein